MVIGIFLALQLILRSEENTKRKDLKEFMIRLLKEVQTNLDYINLEIVDESG